MKRTKLRWSNVVKSMCALHLPLSPHKCLLNTWLLRVSMSFPFEFMHTSSSALCSLHTHTPCAHIVTFTEFATGKRAGTQPTFHFMPDCSQDYYHFKETFSDIVAPLRQSNSIGINNSSDDLQRVKMQKIERGTEIRLSNWFGILNGSLPGLLAPCDRDS